MPFRVAELEYTEEAEPVVAKGARGEVTKERSLPYPVPTLLVAYARMWYVVPGINPTIELLKVPVPVPSEVILSPIVGLVVILQQMPLTVTEEPPSDVTFPPLEALVVVILDAAVVVSVATAIPPRTGHKYRGMGGVLYLLLASTLPRLIYTSHA